MGHITRYHTGVRQVDIGPWILLVSHSLERRIEPGTDLDAESAAMAEAMFTNCASALSAQNELVELRREVACLRRELENRMAVM